MIIIGFVGGKEWESWSPHGFTTRRDHELAVDGFDLCPHGARGDVEALGHPAGWRARRQPDGAHRGPRSVSSPLSRPSRALRTRSFRPWRRGARRAPSWLRPGRRAWLVLARALATRRVGQGLAGKLCRVEQALSSSSSFPCPASARPSAMGAKVACGIPCSRNPSTSALASRASDSASSGCPHLWQERREGSMRIGTIRWPPSVSRRPPSSTLRACTTFPKIPAARTGASPREPWGF